MSQTEDETAATGGRAPRFLLALSPELRNALQKEAFVHGRTLTSEINKRLQASLHVPEGPSGDATKTGNALSAIDRQMLEAFRTLEPEKQIALLALLR